MNFDVDKALILLIYFVILITFTKMMLSDDLNLVGMLDRIALVVLLVLYSVITILLLLAGKVV